MRWLATALVCMSSVLHHTASHKQVTRLYKPAVELNVSFAKMKAKLEKYNSSMDNLYLPIPFADGKLCLEGTDPELPRISDKEYKAKLPKTPLLKADDQKQMDAVLTYHLKKRCNSSLCHYDLRRGGVFICGKYSSAITIQPSVILVVILLGGSGRLMIFQSFRTLNRVIQIMLTWKIRHLTIDSEPCCC